MSGEATRFQPGQSGNPAGKPKGARNRTTLAVEALIDGAADAPPGATGISRLSIAAAAAIARACAAGPAAAVTGRRSKRFPPLADAREG